MFEHLATQTAFRCYQLLWSLAIPMLRMNRRLSRGFDQRLLRHDTPASADLWIQAASVGEAYLVWEIIKVLRPPHPVRILLTTNTRQGLGILNQAMADITSNNRGLTVVTAYFPFDQPAIMKTAVNAVNPKVMVLLETEIWPGLILALKEIGAHVLIINARLTEKSFRRYRICPSLWYSLAPDKILAVSDEDARRYATLFNGMPIDIAPNIKFDRVRPVSPDSHAYQILHNLIPRQTPFLVFGSVRQAEESAVEKIIQQIRQQCPETLIGLFPRHLDRITAWRERLNRLEIPWQLRSQTATNHSDGATILWDTFGELTAAYALAKAAFVGGSLAPLGGQNFLEALTCGVVPVIGPSWTNFKWIGQDIIEHGLVRVTADWKEAAEALIRFLKHPPERKKIQQAAYRYIEHHQGGTETACRAITDFLAR